MGRKCLGKNDIHPPKRQGTLPMGNVWRLRPVIAPRERLGAMRVVAGLCRHRALVGGSKFDPPAPGGHERWCARLAPVERVNWPPSRMGLARHDGIRGVNGQSAAFTGGSA
jgi:hypothetical protein